MDIRILRRLTRNPLSRGSGNEPQHPKVRGSRTIDWQDGTPHGRTAMKEMERRDFLVGMTSLGGVGALTWAKVRIFSGVATGAKGEPGAVRIVQFSDDERRLGAASVPKIVKTDEEWQRLLTPEQFDVTRRAGTERAFTGALYNNHDPGLYRCICCRNALYSSKQKFESGTGWPSFWTPIAKENVVQNSDLSMGMA